MTGFITCALLVVQVLVNLAAIIASVRMFRLVKVWHDATEAGV